MNLKKQLSLKKFQITLILFDIKIYIINTYIKLKQKIRYKKCSRCKYKDDHHCTYYKHFPVVYGNETCKNWEMVKL